MRMPEPPPGFSLVLYVFNGERRVPRDGEVYYDGLTTTCDPSTRPNSPVPIMRAVRMDEVGADVFGAEAERAVLLHGNAWMALVPEEGGAHGA